LLENHLRIMKFNKALLEYYGVDPARVPDFEEYWALYASLFYERLFKRIDDHKLLTAAYERYMENPKLDKRDKQALTFFYNIRRDELDDPDYWNKVGRGSFAELNKNENKIEVMNSKLVKESLNEYYSDDEKLEVAKQEARRISKEEGVAQHVNEIRPGVYRVEDWYDADTTVASYENGRSLDESFNETQDYSPGLIADFNDLAAELEKRRVPCKLQLVDAWGNFEFHILCGWDYPDKIADKAFDAIEASGVNAGVMADQSGGKIVKSKMIAGGPKRYSRW
jgi:hypothetical protein